MKSPVSRLLRSLAFTAVAAVGATTLPAQAAFYKTVWDPLFNTSFSPTVGWRGEAVITVADGCLVVGPPQNVGTPPCTSASLNSATLFFYNGTPTNPLGSVSTWTSPLYAPSQLSIDSFGDIDGMTLSGTLTSNTALFGGYDIELTFALTGPTLRLINQSTPSLFYDSQFAVKQDWQRIPEPGSLLLVGIALAALAFTARRGLKPAR